ncbi:Uncharacterised protein [Vibrio cholerae]|nr:Uncharacterised protein [Vibrio cholerae]
MCQILVQELAFTVLTRSLNHHITARPIHCINRFFLCCANAFAVDQDSIRFTTHSMVPTTLYRIELQKVCQCCSIARHIVDLYKLNLRPIKRSS